MFSEAGGPFRDPTDPGEGGPEITADASDRDSPFKGEPFLNEDERRDGQERGLAPGDRIRSDEMDDLLGRAVPPRRDPQAKGGIFLGNSASCQP